MSRLDDPFGAMSRLLSPDLAEHLLAGTSAQVDLDPSAARVARLLSALRTPAPTAELVERQAVASIVAAIHEAPSPVASHRRSRTFGPRKSARIAVLAASLSAVLAGGSFAAAATGSLPAALQSAVSGALSHVGVSVPNHHGHGSGNSSVAGNGRGGTAGASGPRGVATGPGATSSPATQGLCRAWFATPTTNARSQKDNSVSFVNLEKAAADAGMSVSDYCKGVSAPGGTETTSAPTTVSHGNGNGSTPSSVAHGNGNTPSSVAHGNGNTPSSVVHGPPTSKGNPGHGTGNNNKTTTTT